ncbi:transcriptional regulator, XRE family [Thermoanaerobacter kivui]|uniref:Transcriptional regulator, XRE family n=1 Tax=Thermoanaerobacter kivui TaxID=2325 RepID=A0A097AQA9_THEKI|nr:helix-turn-helix domain-containing protein [Thermoanaerobacter kivui]AIS52000.1 transcriptional regulator, XRE family [Thermoanaerobacter kivui]
MDGFYYDLEGFGKELKNIRKSLRLTQNEVAEQAFINIDTLRKIENGKVMPKQETLDLLSHFYKKDLNEVLLKYRVKDYSTFCKIKNSIENKLESGDFEGLKEDMEKLKTLEEEKMSPYYAKFLRQLLLLSESIYEKAVNKDPHTSLIKLEKAMKVTIPDFSVYNYANFVYSDLEVRILMNIALIFVFEKTEKRQQGLEMLLFCLEALSEEEWEIKIKVYYNISYTYHLLSIYEKSLYYANLGIETCVKNNTLSGLGLLLFRKAIAELNLGREEYKDSLIKSINIFEITGQDKLKKITIESCKKLYNLEITKENGMIVIRNL